MEDNKDQIYIDKIKAGDIDAYRYLVTQYKDMAFTIALKIIKDREEAQDVIQESFIKAYQQLESYEGRAKFSTWLYTIVYRTALNQSKRNKEYNRSFDDERKEAIPDLAISQHQQMEEREQQEIIKEAIEKLPQAEALLVTLYYINENSIKEIKQITGLSLSNIKIKLFRARKKLKKDLGFLIEDQQDKN